MKFLLNIKKYLVLGAVLFGLVSTAMWYRSHLLSRFDELTIAAANEKEARVATESALRAYQANVEQMRQEFAITDGQFSQSADRVIRLQNKLSAPDFDKLAATRPEVAKIMVDNTANDMLRCFEIISGSPTTRDEKNSVTRNSVCQDLLSEQ